LKYTRIYPDTEKGAVLEIKFRVNGLFQVTPDCGIFNLLLTEHEGGTAEYWPEVAAVRTERSEVRTKTTEGQYSPVRLELASLVSSLLYGTRATLVLNLPAFESKKYAAYDRFHGNGPYGEIPTEKGPIRTLGFALPYNNLCYFAVQRILMLQAMEIAEKDEPPACDSKFFSIPYHAQRLVHGEKRNRDCTSKNANLTRGQCRPNCSCPKANCTNAGSRLS